MTTKLTTKSSKIKGDWEKEFDKWFNHGTKKEPRFAYASDAYFEVKDFIQTELTKEREAIIKDLENNYPKEVDDFYKGYNYAVHRVMNPNSKGEQDEV